MRYNYKICYTREKNLLVTDALSRNPLQNPTKPEELIGEAEARVKLAIKGFLVKDEFMKKIVQGQANDQIFVKVREFTKSGWPKKNEIPADLIAYYQYRDDISLAENLLLKGTRIIIAYN